MRFAAFIKEKCRELRRLGRLIFSKCLNRFVEGRRMKWLRATQRWILASALADVGCRPYFFYSLYLPVCWFSPIQREPFLCVTHRPLAV